MILRKSEQQSQVAAVPDKEYLFGLLTSGQLFASPDEGHGSSFTFTSSHDRA